MNKSLILCAALLAQTLGPVGLGAQAIERPVIESFTVRPLFSVADTASATASSLRSRLLTGLVGAVLGAGLGYFASQVAVGDWDEGDDRGKVHRPAWAAVGGAGGLMLGISLPFGRGSPGKVGAALPDDDRFVITGDEIREGLITNALAAVRHFHPEWLIRRGPQSISDPDTDVIRTYYDNVPLGGVEALAGVDAQLISMIRFYDSRQATFRWGMSHPHGAIQVVTLGKNDPA